MYRTYAHWAEMTEYWQNESISFKLYAQGAWVSAWISATMPNLGTPTVRLSVGILAGKATWISTSVPFHTRRKVYGIHLGWSRAWVPIFQNQPPTTGAQPVHSSQTLCSFGTFHHWSSFQTNPDLAPLVKVHQKATGNTSSAWRQIEVKLRGPHAGANVKVAPINSPRITDLPLLALKNLKVQCPVQLGATDHSMVQLLFVTASALRRTWMYHLHALNLNWSTVTKCCQKRLGWSKKLLGLSALCTQTLHFIMRYLPNQQVHQFLSTESQESNIDTSKSPLNSVSSFWISFFPGTKKKSIATCHHRSARISPGDGWLIASKRKLL